MDLSCNMGNSDQILGKKNIYVGNGQNQEQITQRRRISFLEGLETQLDMALSN